MGNLALLCVVSALCIAASAQNASSSYGGTFCEIVVLLNIVSNTL